jgi:uncharacterized membrane protein
MLARYTAASLGLLAFSIAIFAGLLVQNSVTVILSRSLLALFVFFVIGLILGHAAQVVLTEHTQQREQELQRQRALVDESRVGAPEDSVETERSVGNEVTV